MPDHSLIDRLRLLERTERPVHEKLARATAMPSRMPVLTAAAKHPAFETGLEKRVFVDVFTGKDTSLLEQRDAGFSVLTDGLTELLRTPNHDPRIAAGLLSVAFGADRTAGLLRELVSSRPTGPTPPALPELIDMDKLRQAVLWGTITEVIRAFQRLGQAAGTYVEWSSRTTANAFGISGISPRRACASDLLTIQGSFEPSRPPYTAVVVGTTTGCAEAEVVGWSSSGIIVRLPPGVFTGCVGFRVTDGPAPSDPLGATNEAMAAAGMLQSVLGDSFGPYGVMIGQTIVNAARVPGGVSLPCPPCLTNGTGTIPNLLTAGPPIIRSFTVNGQEDVELRPGATPVLSWQVDNADTVEIVASAVIGSYPHRLPTVPGALSSLGGAETLPPIDVDAVDDWDGEYELLASNPCTGTAPVASRIRIRMREKPPLFGLADTHVHFQAHLGFAGWGIFGSPTATSPTLTGEAGLVDALPWCDAPNAHGPGGLSPCVESPPGHLVGGHPEFNGWPRHTTFAHQQAYVDWIKRAVDGGLRLVVCLAVNSELLARRMSELHLNIPSWAGPLTSDDTPAIDRQLDAMRAMVAFVNAQAPTGQKGWMEIAETPDQARAIIAAGRLAVVLGVEVDNLGGWHTPTELEAAATAAAKTPRDLIVELLDALYAKGVRHVFPIHATNNAFGGAGLFVRNYDAANYLATGASFDVATAYPSTGVSYRIDEDVFDGAPVADVLAYHGVNAATAVYGGALVGGAVGGLAPVPAGSLIGFVGGGLAAAAAFPCPPQTPSTWSQPGGHMNAVGLTGHGENLIDELMARGMVIDVDHMGAKSFDGTMVRCEARGYPVVAGHTSLSELQYGYRSSAQFKRDSPTSMLAFGTNNARALAREVDKTQDQIEWIRALGGMVSIFLYQRDVLPCRNGTVPADCSGSSKSFAQALQYVQAKMHGRRLAFGSDVDGAGQLPGPRFGPEAASALKEEVDHVARRATGAQSRRDQVFAQRNGVRYASPIVDYRHHRFMTYSSDPYAAAFDQEERDFWEAIAIWRSGTTPVAAEQPSLQRSPGTMNFIINLATGLGAPNRAAIPVAIPWTRWTHPFLLFFDDRAVQLAAWLAATGQSPRVNDPPDTRRLYLKLAPVWSHWSAMETAPYQGRTSWARNDLGPAGSGLYDAAGALSRSTAGRRDFDINLDGMAHYGLLPDFLQDVSNVGVSEHVLSSLYRSAEDYVRLWERCIARTAP